MSHKAKLINRKNRLTVELAELRETRRAILRTGVQSSTRSTGDGQVSATNLQLKTLDEEIAATERELGRINRELDGRGGLKRRRYMTARDQHV